MFESLNAGTFGTFRASRQQFLRSCDLQDWSKSPEASLNQLGGHLAEMFLHAHGGRGGQRDNSTIAVAGALWESLVIAFLNSVLAGTSAVVVKGVAHVPIAFRETFTISGASGIVSPSYSTFVVDHPCLEQIADGGITHWSNQLTHWLDNEIRREPHLTSVILLDCRTNFSDLIKETVLYDWLLNLLSRRHYPEQMIPEHQSIELIELLPRLGSVSVGLVTGQRRQIKPSAAPARRGQALTGRTFWGMNTVEGVANCMSTFKHVQQSQGNLRCRPTSADRAEDLRVAAASWLA